MSFHLTKGEALNAGVERVVREQIWLALADLDAIADASDQRLHDFRKRCKKLRGMLRLARPALGERFEAEDAAFRRAALHLAAARDASVVQQTLRHIGADADIEARLKTDLDAAIDKARREMLEALDRQADWPFDSVTSAAVARGFVETFRAARQSFRRAREKPSARRLHRLRRWAKYHWYQVRFLERLDRPAMRKRRRRAMRIGELLGASNDLVVLEQRLAAEGALDEQTARRIAKRRKRLNRRALKLCERVFETRPAKIVKRLGLG